MRLALTEVERRVSVIHLLKRILIPEFKRVKRIKPRKLARNMFKTCGVLGNNFDFIDRLICTNSKE